MDKQPVFEGYTMALEDSVDSLGTRGVIGYVYDPSGTEVYRTEGPNWYKIEHACVRWICAILNAREA